MSIMKSIELEKDSSISKIANMVMLGAYLEATKMVGMDSIEKAFFKVFGENKAHLLPINKSNSNVHELKHILLFLHVHQQK